MKINSKETTDNTKLNQFQDDIIGENGVLTVQTGEGRRTDEIGNQDALPLDLYNRCVEVFTNDLFMHVLNNSDYQTLLNLRNVLKAVYELSMKLTSDLSPLCKALIPFNINELRGDKSEKVQFALEHTSVCISSLNISHLQDPALLGADIDIKKEKVYLSFTINNDNELGQLSELLFSDNLSDEQNLILSKIRGLKFFMNVENQNFGAINAVLGFFGRKEYSQLKTLSFEKIYATLKLPEFPMLTTLSFRDICSQLVLPELPSLTTLSFGDINSYLQLPKSKRLTTLSFGNINVNLHLPNLQNLTTLMFWDIKASLELQKLECLTTLWFCDIHAALKLPELPNLTMLSAGDINAALTFSELQNLKTLLFHNIKATLMLSNLQNLTMLSFESIYVPLKLPELESLTSLTFTDIYAELTLPKLQNLMPLDLEKLQFKIANRKEQHICLNDKKEIDTNNESENKIEINLHDQEVPSSNAKYYALLVFFIMLYQYFS